MTIYFSNKDAIDLLTIELMGVSIKTDTAIGYFGTGLKFAIATILRNNCTINLIVDGVTIEFTTITETIRGTNISRVCMDGKPLGFTTQLGKDWHLWQAYRELHSNTVDEGGTISDEMPEGSYGTVFAVDGDKFASEFYSRDEIFVSSPVMAKAGNITIHKGQSSNVFYKTVRVHDLREPSLFKYDFSGHMDLTEDRTLKQPFLISYYLQKEIAKLEDEEILTTVLLAKDGTYEHNLNFLDETLSDEFKQVVAKYAKHKDINRSALTEVQKAGFLLAGDAVTLDDYNIKMFEKSKPLLEYLGCHIELDDFTVVNSLGPNVYAQVVDGNIYISLKTFDMGDKFLASTIYEEWLHKTEGLEDECREMQNFLFEKLLSCVGRLVE